MATAPKNSPSEEARSLVECPVCVSTFRNPKSLRCGHSVCFECCQQLRTALHVVCPVCRTRTPVPGEGLPTNFALQDLVEHHMSQHVERKHMCSACERRHLIDESWICSLCSSALICANCAIKDHRGHDLQMVSDIISRRREELTEWRQRMEGTIREVDARRRQIDANLVRIEQRSIQLNATLRTKLEPRFAENIQELNAERDQLFKAIHDVDVADIIGLTSNDGAAAAHSASRFENQLNEVPQKLDSLKTKQEQILADQRLALEVVQNCNEVLRQVLSTSPKKNVENRQQQSQDGGSVADTSVAGRGIAGYSFAARRGRIFPHLFNDRRSLFSPATVTEAQPDRGRPSLVFERDSRERESRRLDLLFGLHSSGEEDEIGDAEAPVSVRGRLNDHFASQDDDIPVMEVDPTVIDEPVVSQQRPVQANRPAEMLLGRLSTRGRREAGAHASATSAGRLLPAPTVDVTMDMTSDEEAEGRVARGIGRGIANRRSRGGNSLPPRSAKGRGRVFQLTIEPNSPLSITSRALEESSSGAMRADGSDSPVISRVRQRGGQEPERRSSGRQSGGGEDGPGTSRNDSAAGGDIGSRRVDDSSDDDDVAEGILFHTFLHSGGRANDKSKH